MRCINNKIKWTCYDCSVRDGEKASERTASKKMAINNTSGYIGVSLIKSKGIYVSQLKYKGLITIIGDKYEPTEDGLLQGAIDRDLYIIEHYLPHTRNFTDEELLQKLNKNELKKIEKYIIKSKDISK